MQATPKIQPKQPRGLFYLFQTELWERFSYYGVTALLILYLSKSLHLPDELTYTLYGAYGTLIYATPILGGIIADRFLGPYRAVILGGLLIALGHFLLMLQDSSLYAFFSGLSFIIVGTGLFKPNIGTMVGNLYTTNDARRDSGFTLAYLGSNIGTIAAPLIASFIAVKYNTNIAFGLAGIGMLVGLFFFYRGRKHLNLTPTPTPIKTRLEFSISLISLGVLTLSAAIYFFLKNPALTQYLIVIIGAGTILLFTRALLKSSSREKKQLILLMIFIVFYVIFMIMLQQSGGMLNLFTDRFVDRQFLGWQIPTSTFQAVEPLALVLLGPLFAYFWQRSSTSGKAISYPISFAISLIILASAFTILSLAIKLTGEHGKISMWWLNSSYVLQAGGELFIGPIGLAMLTKLTPKRLIGMMMGIWVLGSAIANFSAAKIGALTSNHPDIGTYGHVINGLALATAIAAISLLALTPLLNRLAHKSIKTKIETREKLQYTP
jgi:POT family proton-dependent oligopeptide transporter